MRALIATGLLSVAACLVLGSTAARAGSLLSPLTQSCTGNNCNALRITATYQFDQFNQADPFVTQVYAPGGGTCLRIDVTSQEADLEATLVGADGTIWHNDDRNGSADRRPLIKALTTTAGWYGLVISKFDGGAPSANFSAALGAYVSGNPNCATPTPPSAVARTVK